MSGVWAILAALGLTLAAELPVAAVWLRRLDGVAAVFLVNMLTNPSVNVLMRLVALAAGLHTPIYWAVLVAAEVAVVVAEGLLLSRMLDLGRKKAMIFALVANIASYFTGLLLDAVGIL
ncbi:MAG: hypothetical protein IJY27_04535 [Clostridia bacterium]|nr:hypothetical protein [Clostridia bacterium]